MLIEERLNKLPVYLLKQIAKNKGMEIKKLRTRAKFTGWVYSFSYRMICLPNFQLNKDFVKSFNRLR